MEKFKPYLARAAANSKTFLKWLIVSIAAGLTLGLVGALFYHCLAAANEFRTQNPQIIFLLPLAGLVIVFMYRMAKDDGLNTNLIISAIHSDTNVPLKITPLIFISTVLTNLFGGSSGREGAAVQIGGGIGYYLSGIIKLDEFDRRVFTMCCVSAAFSAVFGTPIAAAIFAIEVVSVGIMYYSALVPCAIASLTADTVAKALDCRSEQFHVLYITEFKPDTGLKTMVVAIAASLVSILFVVSLKYCEYHFKKYIKNQYLRVFTGGVIIVVLTLLLKTTDYNGVGIPVMERAFRGEVVPWAFLLKIIFTAITLGCGFKGGEIMPSFYIGSTLGCFIGRYLGISPSLCAAVGMVSVFCGVTNCPIASLIISLELFGMDGIKYYLLAIAVSYMLSGYYGLYNTQKIIYSKYKNQYVNKIAHH
ncbi:MAG: chloride channel protein [Firmicutes bacterium]|nr:chloride channel protein [Bacillota bacterium]